MSSDSIPMFWRSIASRYRMEARKCKPCKTVYYPPRYICPKCGRNIENTKFKLSGKGKLITFTITNIAPHGLEHKTPYIMGIIELIEGPRVAAEIVGIDSGQVKKGMRVKAAFRKLGTTTGESVIVYGNKFTPELYPTHHCGV